MDRRVIALGFFDGVHIGHAALLRQTTEAATHLGVKACAMTFDHHPDTLILGNAQPLINTLEDREDIMTGLHGIEQVLPVVFDDRLMHMPWREFVSGVLARDYGATHLVAGHDFHFGYKGEGNPERLKAICSELGLGCDIVSEVSLDGIKVSSTYIRRLVAQGDMERAQLFLGHPHRLTGTVGHGRQLGRALGAPTVNLPLPDGIQSPAHGVYVTQVRALGGLWPAVTNVGLRPTVSRDGGIVVETTLLDFSGQLYDERITVEFLHFLRSERRFADTALLAGQIALDIEDARRYFKL